MIKTGIVLSVLNRKAGIMTSSGEFLYIKTRKILPKIGEIRSGVLCTKFSFFYKYALTAASLMFIFISSVLAYAYYTPVTTVALNINPSISVQANRWNKIISSKALDSDGFLILKNIVLKNKSIDYGLELLIKEAKTENFINDKYVNDKKIINLNIDSNKDISIDISNFKKIIDSNKLIIKINVSSLNNKTIDLIVNNKKWAIDNNPIRKPSVDINTNITEDKSSDKGGNKNNTKPNTNKDNNINKDNKPENKNQNKLNNNSSIVEKSDSSNISEKNLKLEKNKNSQMQNGDNNFEKPTSEIPKKSMTNKHSSNNESVKKKDNDLNKFLKANND